MNDELLKALESVANELFNLKLHAAYIRLTLQMEKWLQTRGLRWYVNAGPATDGKSYMY
jgi:hypothetical protein